MNCAAGFGSMVFFACSMIFSAGSGSIFFHPLPVCRPNDHQGVMRDRLFLGAEYTRCSAGHGATQVANN